MERESWCRGGLLNWLRLPEGGGSGGGVVSVSIFSPAELSLYRIKGEPRSSRRI